MRIIGYCTPEFNSVENLTMAYRTIVDNNELKHSGSMKQKVHEYIFTQY